MNFTTTIQKLSEITADLLVLRFFEGETETEPQAKQLDQDLGSFILPILRAKDFKGQLGETLILYPRSKSGLKRIVLLGMGKRNEFDLEKLRAAVSSLAPLLKKFKVKHLVLALRKNLPKGAGARQAIHALVESLALSTYRFLAYKKSESEKDDERVSEIEKVTFALNSPADKAQVQEGAQAGLKLARIVNFARDLGNHPSNIATPSHLSKHALDLAKEYPKSVKAKILHRDDIKKENMGALLAVAQGSDEEPKFIILEYKGTQAKPQPVVLVGKGITFDSGGISIKPSDKMEEMKYDMMGAATVMGVIKAAAELKLPANLIGLIPTTENLPSGKAIKPGDIIRSRSGKTIEIVNTDAEGRLILADALDYAKKYKPSLVIDFATLTGAIVVALGDDLIGAFANQEALLPPLRAAAELTGEKIWPMPLEPSYEEFIKSDFADLRNISTQPKIGDAIHAANFLRQFVDYPWIHLDIAGTAWTTREKPYRPKGATGVGIRLAIEFLKRWKK